MKIPSSSSSSVYLLIVVAALAVHSQGPVEAFSPQTPSSTKKLPSQTNPFLQHGIDVELPDFDELFDKIKQVSPLARSVLSSFSNNGNDSDGSTLAHTPPPPSLSAVKQEKEELQWKKMESNSKSPVQEIEKIDNFDKKGSPLFRFRSSFQGPCVGEFFGKFIIDLEERKKWDKQIANVYEAYSIAEGDYQSLDAANIAMGYGKYGDCSRLGIGYAQTKAGVISPREQLFLYGLQQVGRSCIIFGKELDHKHNNLLPEGPRHTRAQSHLFSATLTPTGDDRFDIEYALQFDVGGGLPNFMTTPVLVDTVKSLFASLQKTFEQNNEALLEYLEEKQKQDGLGNRHGLLMTY